MTLSDIGYDESRIAFFKLAFGRNPGYMALAFLSPDRKSFTEAFFRYPNELPEAAKAIRDAVGSLNVYFCPNLFEGKSRRKEGVVSTPTAWADLDTCHPDLMEIRPSIVIESSFGRYQALWSLADVEPDDAELLSKRIAYAHAEDGADRSGWDLTQLLRVPFTYNFKYNSQVGELQEVKVIDRHRSSYRLSDFEDKYPPMLEENVDEVPMPDVSDMPAAEDLLQAKRLRMNPLLWSLFNIEPGEDWSKALWQLHMLCFESGFDKTESFIIARDSKCNKYARDGRPNKMLWKEVVRAHERGMKTQGLLQVSTGPDAITLLTEEEKLLVSKMPPTFVERYIKWAKGLGDAAEQYHQAGAFIILSSLLSGNVRLPTSFGTFIPNIWFMILADTTLTRKSTAMDLATDLLTELDEDIVLATDGSIEGLMGSLSLRPGRPSIFLRDEFSGLLESMTKKDYYAGMAEVFTKLYDGKAQKRVLRKETMEVRDPRLILFAGGIKDKVTGLLTFEQVSSGFMPRFIFITAESDVTRVKPLGPPTLKTDEGRDRIMHEMRDLQLAYQRKTIIEVPKMKAKVEQPLMFEAALTDEAWIRYNELEMRMLKAGTESEFRSEVLTPTYDRLSKSILKCAVLLAASRTRDEDVVVTMDDLLKAIAYGETWKRYADDVMSNIGKSTYERQMQAIHRLVWREPGVSRSKIMQHYHLTAKMVEEVLSTMDQRGLLERRKAGRTETLFPTSVAPLGDRGVKKPA